MTKGTAVPLPVPMAGDPWWALWESYERSLNAEQRSPRTLEAYRRMARHFHEWATEHHSPTDPAEVRRQHLEAFLIHLRDELGQRAATIRLAYAALHGFWRWLIEEEEVSESPLARLKAPKVDEPAPEILEEDELAGLLKACAGTSFLDRRDAALIRFALDTGLRRAEILNVKLEDLMLRDGAVRVVRKGARSGVAFFGPKTARDLDRYLRARARQSGAASPWLWLPGSRGGERLLSDGLATMLTRRAAQAGLSRRIHPHQFRHAFAHLLKSGGASDEDVLTAGGWRDPKVLRRYAAAKAVDRAQATHRRLSPGDRV